MELGQSPNVAAVQGTEISIFLSEELTHKYKSSIKLAVFSPKVFSKF